VGTFFKKGTPGRGCENRVATAAFKMKSPSPRQRANPAASRATIAAALPGGGRHSGADISKISKNLGYAPEYDFEKGIKEAIQWYNV